MTVSMFTTRLSSVMTGCGANETTCSRRSILSRMRSTNGTTSVSPGVSVRLYRPRRSTTPARACGMMRTVRASTKSTKSATTASTISVVTTGLLFVDERRRALDLDDLGARTRLEHLVLHVRPSRPLLAADANAPAVQVDALDHERFRADERVCPHARRRRQLQVPLRHGPHESERGDRA